MKLLNLEKARIRNSDTNHFFKTNEKRKKNTMIVTLQERLDFQILS